MRRKLIILAVAVLGLAVASFLLPVRAWAVDLVEWIRAQGPTGVAVFGVVYVVATVLLIPASALTLGAGFIYGVVAGTLVVAPAALLGATLAFILSRHLGRAAIRRRLEGRRRFAALDRAIGKEGFKLALLVRLSPLFPFGLTNYALGVTDLSLRHYVIGSAIGMLPGTVLYVFLGSLITSASALGAGPEGPWATTLYWGGLVVTAVVVIMVTGLARRALRRELGEAAT